ncbi:MAG: nucleotidyl transferase AbiEii/AbiGii toxin family protein [Gammaproteobacteria bacterium]|nr:nucleotidyl transferase AbiEii/AbiGii toxin family protein [Gammaproteobacteria bacterium]MDE0224033.1 nucleotidyl transferase AbiEii/AbiGii toxin family protein [Gammaproteobacteria bacterium]
MIAEKEIILTYLLQLFSEKEILRGLAFKGGTCLRKIHIGSQGRFSTDLDFTGTREHDPEDLILEMMAVFEGPYHGITFDLDDEYYETKDGLSWGINPTYRHPWNTGGANEIRIQISYRETPTLPTESLAQCEQSYFKELEFTPARITSLALDEMIAEKIRACCQRSKARDIYDLGIFAVRPLNHDLIRRLVVLKLWQSRTRFEPEKLIEKLSDGQDFDWSDLAQLVNKDHVIDQEKISSDCASGYRFLTEMSEDEKTLASNPYENGRALWEKLRNEIQDRDA